MVIFTLVCFMLMLLIGGIAVDLMRYERARTKLQGTMDRAVLAAASLRQQRDPDLVVQDYFAKAGLADRLTGSTSVSVLGLRDVSATAQENLPTFFMHSLGINTLEANIGARAVESVTPIEISMVLDISGSMRFNNKIGELRKAAKNFFKIVLDGDAATTTSINIVPYAGQVNVGPLLFTRYGGVRNQAFSSCLELQPADYLTAAEPTYGLAQVPHFMKWAIDLATMNWGWCPTDNSAILLAQNDRGVLDSFIDGVRLHDGTGTMTGVKYGVMLLNPATMPSFAALSGNGVAPQFADRPLQWPNTPNAEVTKYMIVMTDGEITDQFRPKRTGVADGDADALDNETYNGVADPDTVDGTDFDLWNRTTETDLQPASLGANMLTSRATNLANFYSQCNLAKANGVVVYTVAFETSLTAQQEMANCSSGPGYHLNATGTQINSAFEEIARRIRPLKLTQ